MIPPDTPRELVTRKEIQQRCKVSAATVKRWAAPPPDGFLKPVIERGGVLRYYWDEVLDGLSSRSSKRRATKPKRVADANDEIADKEPTS
jgi:predicted site-specific integrase-resolvase